MSALALSPKPSRRHNDKTQGVLFHWDQTRQETRSIEYVEFAIQMQSAILIKGHQKHIVPFLCLLTGHSRDEILDNNDP